VRAPFQRARPARPDGDSGEVRRNTVRGAVADLFALRSVVASKTQAFRLPPWLDVWTAPAGSAGLSALGVAPARRRHFPSRGGRPEHLLRGAHRPTGKVCE
jgi:hypothetical protein